MVAVLAISYVIRVAWHAQLPSITGPLVAAILLTAFAVVLTIPVTAWAWARLLEPQSISVRTLAVILGQSQMAKYLPGNVGHHLARSALALQRGLRARMIVTAIGLETAGTIAAALAVGSFGLGISERSAVLTVGGIVVLAGLTILRRGLVLAYALNMVLVGLGLAAVAGALTSTSGTVIPRAIGAFAFAWIAGFVLPGAPAGLGVREAVLTALLSPALDRAVISTVVLTFRLGTTLGDCASLGLAWLAARGISEPAPNGHR